MCGLLENELPEIQAAGISTKHHLFKPRFHLLQVLEQTIRADISDSGDGSAQRMPQGPAWPVPSDH